MKKLFAGLFLWTLLFIGPSLAEVVSPIEYAEETSPIVYLSDDSLTLELNFARHGNLLHARSGVTFSRASNATVTDSDGVLRTVGSNVARFDHDSSGTALGLLIESAATNILFNSLTPATQTRTISNATEYTISIIGSGSLILSGGLAGTATEGSPVTVTSTSTSGTFTLSGSADGIQCETGPTASSIVPTAGVAATRAADVATMAVADINGFSQSEGTWVVEASIPHLVQQSISLFQVDDGTSTDRLRLIIDTNDNLVGLSSTSVGNTLGTGLNTGPSDGERFKAALAYETDNGVLAWGGDVDSTADTSCDFPLGDDVITLRIGSNHASGTQPNGHIASIKYYNKRLSDYRFKNGLTQ